MGQTHSLPTLLKQTAVGIKSARITLQVVLVVELGRIEKNRNYRHIILLNTTFHQRGVALVKRAHCRHQSDCLTFFTNFKQLILKFNNTSEKFHLNYFFLKPMACRLFNYRCKITTFFLNIKE